MFPDLAVGGAASTGAMVQGLVCSSSPKMAGAIVPAAAHWLVEENPAATLQIVEDYFFLEALRRPLASPGVVVKRQDAETIPASNQ